MRLDILSVEEYETWDQLVTRNTASGFMQTTLWARFKEAEGYTVHRLGICDAGSLIGGAVCYWYPAAGLPGVLLIPGGPVLPWERHDIAQACLQLLLDWARETAADCGAYAVRLEPALEPPLPHEMRGWIRAPIDLYPCQTLIVDLVQSTPTLRAALHPKCRYNIGLAVRRGVTVWSTDEPSALRDFYALFRTTAERHEFFAEPYGFFINLMGAADGTDAVRFYFATLDDMPVASALVLSSGDTATFLYGGSALERQRDMPSYALQWAIMSDARERGMKRYDMYGCEPLGIADHPYAGFSRFKRQFGGRLVTYLGAHDYVFYDRLANAVATTLRGRQRRGGF